MAIVYDPKDMLKKIAPESKIKKLVSGRLTLKKAALNFVDAVDFIDKKAVSKIALKTIDSYQKRIANEQVEAGLEKSAGVSLEKEILANPKQLIQRVQNEVVWQIANGIKEQYGDEDAEWLPSDAEEPDPEHQLNYGKIFRISEGINGEIPGERIGCRCGMRILVKQTKLNLE
jgi:hypothetical protein